MIPTGTCPDDILCRARSGALTAMERQRLERHVAHCAMCACAMRTGSAFDMTLAERPGDDVLIARVASGALGRWAPQRRRFPRFLSARAVAIVAATLVTSAVAVAATGIVLYARRTGPAHAPERLHPSEAVATSVGHVTPRPPPAPTLAAPTLGAPTLAAPMPARSLRTAPAVALARAHVPSRIQHHESVAAQLLPALSSEPEQSAEQLFAAASEARHANNTRVAVDLYRRLTLRYPASREAHLSRALLGRVLLDEVGNAQEALVEFDAYLSADPHGTLEVEALWGRGRSLERLGRGDAARAVWRTIVDRYAGSVYAARARQRLAPTP